ncbi:LuxR C-terminal-related transcriptional regulator [Catenuloplanes sp. NPDC051500]|uniref:helix-turn-helix transcriptional regulator n=1 Tax=Catenuloplanes sp. NPDC051500 TaxID=3363959 RepID=UPI00379E74F8
MDDALSVQISRVSGPELRDALAALIATALDRSHRDPLAVSALAARLGEAPPGDAPPGDAPPGDAVPDDTPPADRVGVAPRDAPPADRVWDARRGLAEATRAWASGDAARASALLRRLDPATLSAETAAAARLLTGEITLRTGGPGDAVTSMFEAADLLAARPRAETPGAGAGRAADSRWPEADALVRVGEAICFLGDHLRYDGVTRRAVRLGLVRGGNPPGEATADPADDRRRGGPVGACGETGALTAQIEGFGALFEGRYPRAVSTLRRVVTAAESGRPQPDLLEVSRRAAGGLDPGRPAMRDLGPPGPELARSEANRLVRGSAAALACGDDGAALRLAARAEAVARAAGEASVVPRALELKSSAELWRGAHDAAESTALAGARAAVEAGQPNEADNHLAMVALLAALRGDRAACRWRLAQLSGGYGRPRALGRWALALLDLQAGRPLEAAARIGGIADVLAGRGHALVQVMAAPDLVEAAVLAGEPGMAGTVLTAFDRWAASTGEPLRLALSARCHALLARRGSAAAEAGFREAVRLHLAGESEFERARTQLLFGRDLRRRRRPGQAREQVGAALDAFERCGARPWAEQARAELRVCGGDPRAVPAPLTAQQLQIARLVADGATNREVAARLFLSTRTVDHHMRNIFHRLGISSRTALAKMIT